LQDAFDPLDSRELSPLNAVIGVTSPQACHRCHRLMTAFEKTPQNQKRLKKFKKVAA
jgi:hypothetical protein